MKKKIIFTLILLELLLLLILTQVTKEIEITGRIHKINYAENRIVIKLTDHSEELVLFGEELLNLKEGEEVLISGRKENFRNKTQILVDQIMIYPK
jgi:DNA/RNA endonuclease YhcR with UshA esterase domain